MKLKNGDSDKIFEIYKISKLSKFKFKKQGWFFSDLIYVNFSPQILLIV